MAAKTNILFSSSSLNNVENNTYSISSETKTLYEVYTYKEIHIRVCYDNHMGLIKHYYDETF